MANGSSGHLAAARVSRAAKIHRCREREREEELVERSSIGRSIDRSRRLLFVSFSILLAERPIRGDIVRARLTKVRRGEKRLCTRAPETPRIRIDEDRCNVSNHSSRQGQEEEPLSRERNTVMKQNGLDPADASECVCIYFHTRASLPLLSSPLLTRR